jgi:flagellar biosynthetic protein FliR
MRIDISFLPALAATFMLVFARIGIMVMLLPGLGEMTVPSRVRLSIALLLAAVLLPLHRNEYQIDLRTFGPVATMLAQEMFIGALLGFVTAVDPTQGQQSVIVANFLTMLALALVFAADLHHLVIAALNDSYALFRPGEMPLVGDVAAHTTATIALAFKIGIQLSAPFIVFGLLFNLGLGVLSRLMPQMQVFFIGLPASIIVGFLILILVIGSMMTVFLSALEGTLRQLAPFS